jgi:hypothetical protein
VALGIAIEVITRFDGGILSGEIESIVTDGGLGIGVNANAGGREQNEAEQEADRNAGHGRTLRCDFRVRLI